VPEGDTIHRTAAALRAALLGKSMTAFEAPRLTGLHPTPGSVIERVDSRGKHLEIGWDDGIILHTHMRMSGSWHLYRPGERWRKGHSAMRVVIEVPGFQAVCFSAPVVETYRARTFSRHPGLGSLGPDLMREDADIGECVTRMGQFCERDETVADALLDQRVACGVGNVYKSETLWMCELHPFTPVGALDDDQRRRLIETAARLLRANADGPGRVTVPDSPDGVAVYGRFGKPCLRCGQPIEVRRHGEQVRVTYWCPSCQLLLELPDSGESEPPDEAPKRRFGRRRKTSAPPVADSDSAGEPATVGDESHREAETDDSDPSGERPVERTLAIDRHPAAQQFLVGRPFSLEPAFVDPLLARHAPR
jgi:endonuclease VIII